MRRWLTVAMVLGVVAGVPAVGSAAATTPVVASRGAAALDASMPHDEHFVLARLAPTAGRSAGHYPVMGRWVKAPVLPGEAPIDAVARLSARTDVEIAELDLRYVAEPLIGSPATSRAPRARANDPLRYLQWHLDAAAVDGAWIGSRGGGVTVAVIDTGVSAAGEDLRCHSFVAEYNSVTGASGPGAAADFHGHGTHVAGTIAQCTDNGVGVAGVAPDVRLMPIKVIDGSDGSNATLAAGIDWARRHGADVINLSIGAFCLDPWPTCGSAIVDDAIAAAVEDDVLLVAASGNDSYHVPLYPAGHPDVLAVGAVDMTGERAYYSSGGDALDLTAPGGDPYTDRNGDGLVDGVVQETFLDGQWGYWAVAGTSMAAPHVAGTAALLRSQVPGAPAAVVAGALRCSAVDRGPVGADAGYGYGSLDAAGAAIALRQGGFDTEPPAWPAGSALVAEAVGATTITLSWPRPEDCGGVAGYRVYVDGIATATPVGRTTVITVGGLEASTEYRFRVEARDLEGRWTEAGIATAATTRDDPSVDLDTGPAVGFVDPGTGMWHLMDGHGAATAFYYGNPGDVPFTGDWDCDGEDSPGLQRRSDGYVYLRNSATPGNADLEFYFGNPGDVAVSGDFDGDGCDTVSLYRPSEETFYVINKLGDSAKGLGKADYSFRFGETGDVPFAGDLNHDGTDEFGVHRPSTGWVHVRWGATGPADLSVHFAEPGDVVLVADFDGDGNDTLARWLPAATRIEFLEGGEPFVWGRPHWLPVGVQ